MDMILNVSESQIGQVISARELYNFMEVKSRFNDWILRKIEKYKFIENADFIALTQKRVTAQGNSIEETNYLLTMDMAKEISMIENNDKGREARKYFISCEKKYTQLLQSRLEILERDVLEVNIEYKSSDWGMETLKNNITKVELIEKEIERLIEFSKPLYEEIRKVSVWKKDHFMGMYQLFRDEESKNPMLGRDEVSEK